MSTAVIQPKRWSPLRWGRVLILVFALQVGLIFCLSERQPVKARLPHASPSIHLTSVSAKELLGLTDPTLFALPHRNGFSGKAWLKQLQLPLPSLDWSEPTNWLPLAVQQLGAVFNQVTQTNNFAPWPVLRLPEPLVKLPATFGANPALSQSTLRVEGELAKRRLLNPLELRSWPRGDLLTNTIVQMVVDTGGHPVSVPVLLTTSGDKEADDNALEQARRARFEPVPGSQPPKLPVSELTWGKLIFEWAIVPLSATNAPVPGPAP